MNFAMFSCAIASAIASSRVLSAVTSIFPRIFPLTCTAIVTTSSTSKLSSATGHVSYAFEPSFPSFVQSSSERCGAYGDSKSANGLKHSLGFFSHFVAALVNSIIAAMAVLNRIPSVSSVTFATHLLISFSCASSADSSEMSPSNSRCARARNREHPSTPFVCHTLVSRRGPMNISYRRSESAPYASTISSGLTTFPRDLDILCARAFTLIFSSAARTNPSPFFATSSALIFTASSPSVCSAPLALTYFPSASTNAVYSTSPKIIPCDTSRWNGSLVLTAPMSYSTLCQNRA
eukprot:15753-Pelagococcus_subviridis.AAC.2